MPFLKGTGSFGVVGTAPPEPSSLRDKLMRVWGRGTCTTDIWSISIHYTILIGVEALILL